MSRKAANTPPLSLPPKIPETPQALERAIHLLGNRTQRELKEKTQQELVELLNAAPDAATAAIWKQSLRKLSKEPTLYQAVLQSQKPSLFGQVEEVSKIQEKKFLLASPSSGLPLPTLLRETAAQVQLNPETGLMLAWASQALEDYYLDDERCYDRQLVALMQRWLDAPEQAPPSAFLAQKFLALNIALSQAKDPFEFDLAAGDFSLEKQPITSDKLSFVEPLLRQALSRVDWCAIGDYLIEKLSLEWSQPKYYG